MHRIFSKGALRCTAAALALSALILFTTGAAASESLPEVVIIEDGNVVSGITMAGQDMGSQTEQQAAETIEQTFQNNIDDYAMSFTYLEVNESFTAEQLGISVDSKSMVHEMMIIGRQGSLQQRLDERNNASSGQVDIPIKILVDGEKLNQTLDEFIATIPTEPSKEEVVFKPELPERFEFTERRDGFQPDAEAFKANVRAAIDGMSFGEMAVDGQVVQPDGTPSDVIENTVLVSSFTTEYKSSASGRIHNIKTAADFINGKVLQPGEVFSANDTIGPRTSASIWQKAPAIENKVYKQQLGGGVCQVSTTVFNAAAMADLEIVDWTHHSWPSTYVDIGCDATINTGTIDFQFKNNTDWPIYMVANADTTARTITVEIWGRPLEDGMSIKIKGERTGTTGIPSTPVYVTDSSETSKGRIGQYSATYKIWYDRDGNEVKRENIDKHYYQPVAPRVLKQAAATPPPVAEQPAQPEQPVQPEQPAQPAEPEQPASNDWPADDPGMEVVTVE